MKQGIANPAATVAWRIGATRDHPHLRAFVCTDDASIGEEPWSEQVQDWFNNDLHLPGARRVRDIEFHCGYVAKALAAVATWMPDHEPGDSHQGRHWYVLPALAVGWEHRRKGGKLADAAVERVLAAVDDHALEFGASEIKVFARVHVANLPAQLLFEAKGFERFTAMDDGPLQVWLKRWPGPGHIEDESLWT